MVAVTPDAVERVIHSIPIETIRDCVERYKHHGFTEDSALRFLRANLAIAARRVVDMEQQASRPEGVE